MNDWLLRLGFRLYLDVRSNEKNSVTRVLSGNRESAGGLPGNRFLIKAYSNIVFLTVV